jgi:hypothetical protein
MDIKTRLDARIEGAAKFWVGAAIFCTAGAVFSLSPPLLFPREASLDGRATGRVVELPEDEGFFHPVVEYTPPGGAAIRARSGTGYRPAPAQVGEPVTVRFDLADPDRFEIGEPMDLSLVRGALSFLAAVMSLIGVALLFFCVGSLAVGARNPENLRAWWWWANFVTGIMGALSFALPSILVYPVYLVALPRLPAAWPLLYLVFSIVGVIVLAVTILTGRRFARERPRWR